MNSSSRTLPVLALAAAAAGFFACGSEADEAPGSGGVLIDTGKNDAIDPDAGCFYDKEEGKNTPLHLFIALDKSASMASFKWAPSGQGR